jgi:hypothetical protein
MLLESITQTTTQADPQPVTTIISYSITETNIFSSSPNPSPSIPEFPIIAVGVVIVVLTGVVLTLILVKRKK